ncbi:MAG: hypothetical protein LJE95_05705 [Acidobacteria bacterium]|jgi:hypothetical protein|nr:hypothetical protein [Acidobacteriota bacterium]
MPHIVLAGSPDIDRLANGLQATVYRWRRSVLKTTGWWRRQDDAALLVEGVVVEYSRPLHPVALVTPHHADTMVCLWPAVTVERTPAVQRWLALVAAALRRGGAGTLVRTNLPPELLEDLDL